MSTLSILELLKSTSEAPTEAEFITQVQAVKTKETKGGKPYLEWTLADSTGSFTLKVWNNHPQWQATEDIAADTLLHFYGSWTQNKYGIDGQGWKFRFITEEETDAFLAGDPATREKQEQDYQDILDLLSTIKDPRLQALNESFLSQFGTRFRRTAAARKNHHARRGGLVEHVAQMMRSANALGTVYQDINIDLVLTGVLFHDCGKLWENSYPEKGFNQTQTLHGEMIGHIPLGMELVNRLWRELDLSDYETLKPSSEDVRLHLLHLVASHHGELAFGSPTLPRTPEAFILHYVDNIDAKLEMVKDVYQKANEVAPGIYERQFPLPSTLVDPLPKVESQPTTLGELF